VLHASPGFAEDFGIEVNKSVAIVDPGDSRPGVGEQLVLTLMLHRGGQAMQTTGRPYPATPQVIADVKRILAK
jgi:hypothetical protein